MSVIKEKKAFPYITIFKKEPFKSFVLLSNRDIGSFYFSQYNKIMEVLEYYNENLLKINNLNLENVFWFLLLKKYLREERQYKDLNEGIFEFITNCEEAKNGELGFKFSPHSQQKKADIWSTYFALSSLKLIGMLPTYLKTRGQGVVITEIKNFISSHDKGDSFLHCLDKNCEICKKTPPVRTLFFVLEILNILGVDIRTQKSKFLPYLEDLKEKPSIVFKILCLKLLDLDLKVEEEHIQFLHQFQRENGGFSFKKIHGRINTTFWITYTLNNFSWLLDYNPSGIYSFVNKQLNQLLRDSTSWDITQMMKISKLIIVLSYIWNKFIEEIERIIFKELQEKKYVDFNYVKSLFGLSEAIEEIISYVNLNYTFNLKILDNRIEFRNYLRNLTPSFRDLASEIYEQLKEQSVISLSDIMDKYNSKYSEYPIKIKEINSIVEEMIEHKFFEGKIKTRKKYLFITKYYFYLDFLLEKIVISDTNINTERLFEEKSILKDIRNDIYNMTLKLKNTSTQIKDEIESYLLINEIDIAKERLKFIVRDALMEADFLNENIENSFNEDLYYINLQATLGNEISRWNKYYSILSKRLKTTESQLKEAISEKEELRKYNTILDGLDSRLINLEEHFNKEIDSFRKYLSEILSEEYTPEKFNLISGYFDKIVQDVQKFDKVIYRISQKIKTSESELNKKHKRLIHYWISIKEELEEIFNYYKDGLIFFKEQYNSIDNIYSEIKKDISQIDGKAQFKVEESKFQEAFNLIKKESNIILEKKLDEIKNYKKIIKKEINSKQKLYVLYKYLQEKLEKLEEDIIDIIADKVQFLKDKVIEERNRAKIESFDNFVSDNIIMIRKKLADYKQDLEHSNTLSKEKIKSVVNEFDKILNIYMEIDEEYNEILDENNELIDDFEEKSNLTIMQWNKFGEYIQNEIKNLKEDYINRIITNRILLMAEKEGSNNISIKKLAKKLDIKCKEAKQRIRDMIEISKFNGKLYEDEKCLVVYTEHYYKNRKLRNFINNNLMKYKDETIGKTLSLYDSCIRNRTLGINMIELTNRVNELDNFEDIMKEQFTQKVDELDIDIGERKEYENTKEYFENLVANSSIGIRRIKKNLKIFKDLQNYISQEYNKLSIELEQKFAKIIAEIEEADSYEKIEDYFNKKQEKFEETIDAIREAIEEKIYNILEEENKDNLIPEIREFFVNKKNQFLENYNKDVKKVSYKIIIRRNELFRSELLNYISNSKIHLSQLLGMLQTRVEDDIEIKEFKRAYSKIDKRTDIIYTKIEETKKKIKKLVKEFNKQSKGFETKNKYILDDFEKYINEFNSILLEKVKTLERTILQSFVQMAIRAVANKFITVSFLNQELKIRKQNIQDHLLTLISTEKLDGKYDPRLGIYYEDPKILENLDENELQVIKKMNYRVYMVLTRLKNFTSHYSSIIAFFASILTLSYYLLLLSGGNPFVLIIPTTFIIALVLYLFQKKREEKINV
ncbi:MAG: hypothetical protein GF317_20410 [Candidatus Lokiarchaeota archaeon]|nr:hypothetical protein [Candidatus Lokiarchaeota archaeon]MBD3201849.1 hypothetical protein [Candidatus Lokiarchaeota archaeon]